MRRIAMLFILVMALVVSGCTIKPETDRKADQPRAADYSREAGTHTLNVRFLSGEGYVVLVPDRDLSAEEYAERETASATPPATCEVYKDDALMFSLVITGSFTGPSIYEQGLARAEANGSLLSKGSTDICDYFFYQRVNPEDETQTDFYYMGKFKNTEDIGFTAFSGVSQKEAEKQFNAMEMWFTERSMTIRNIAVDKVKSTIEADFFPETSVDGSHITVDLVVREITSVTGSEGKEISAVYAAKALEELLAYVDQNKGETELVIKWE